MYLLMRQGLLSDVTALLAKQNLSVISAATWSQHLRAALVIFVEAVRQQIPSTFLLLLGFWVSSCFVLSLFCFFCFLSFLNSLSVLFLLNFV